MNKKTILSRSISAGLAALMLLSALCAFVSCKNSDDLPLMPLMYVQGLADRGRDTVLSDLTKYRNTKYDSENYILYQFTLENPRFTLWAGYYTETGVVEYLCLTHIETRDTLYLFHRGNEKLADGSMKFGDDASPEDVAAFVEAQLAEK